MVDRTKYRAWQEGIHNILLNVRDVVENGTGLENESAVMVLLFNILHFDERKELLKEAARLLKPGGEAAIIHWRKDIPTPRGPLVSLRPDRGILLKSIEGLDLHCGGDGRMLEPYHWGIKLKKVKARATGTKGDDFQL